MSTGKIKLSHKFSERLKLLRSEKNLSQREFAYQLSMFMGREKKFSIPTISSWELGNKQPDYPTIISIANFYGVSNEFLTGKSESRDNSNEMKPFFMDKYLIEISLENLVHYDGKPVFLVFDNISNKVKNCWGIYNKDQQTFACRDHVYRNNPAFRYFAAETGIEKMLKRELKPLDLEDFINLKIFWVEYFGSTTEINNRFSGFYHHTQTKSGIINDEGNILPYAGLNQFYRVYRGRP